MKLLTILVTLTTLGAAPIFAGPGHTVDLEIIIHPTETIVAEIGKDMS